LSAPPLQPRRLLPLALLATPLLWLCSARGEVIGGPNMDLVGHLSTMLHCSQGQPFRTTMVAWPHGADLLTIVGGWADIFIACPLVEPLGLGLAYNLVFTLYLVLAGIGAWALARQLGASGPAAVVAGLLLQLDGFVLRNMTDGRLEQGALGLMALAIAGALHCWRRPSWAAAVGAGVAGALTVFASWELALFLAMAMALLSPWILAGERAPGALGRWALAAAITAALAGPWAWLFYERASAVRDLYEGLQALGDARIASVGLLGWFAGRTAANPATPALLALLALPWTVTHGQRRLWLGLAALLLATLLLALGPDPGLWVPGDLAALRGRGVYAGLQRLPVLGWFHTPDRFLCCWSLLAPVAAARLLDRAAAWRGWLGPGLAALMLGSALGEARFGEYQPHGGYHIPDFAGLERLAALPGEGVVLDLPVRSHRLQVLPYQAMQLTHRRPIPYHMTSPLLTRQGVLEGEEEPFLRWFEGQVKGLAVEPLVAADLAALHARGFRFVALNTPALQARARARATTAMERALGPPQLREGDRWLCWDLSTLDQTSE
jgi:hypothetical protein